VHALSEGGIAAAVKAGADLVVHGGFASSATVAEMRTRSVFQLPTLFSLSTNKPADFKALQDHMRRAVGAGLPIAFGTDAGVIAHGRNTQEFLQLEAIGVDAAAALRTATLAAARAVGLADQIGMLRAGYAADVIGVAGNPLLDLRVLQNVTFVMKGGTVFKRDSRPAQ
jgi:imidazolonepropionase-like amidohydrolase